MNSLLRTRFLPPLLTLLACLGLTWTLRAGNGPDVQRYLIAKGQFFKQVGTGAPALLPSAEEPFAAIANVEARDSDSVKSATLRTPLGDVVSLERHGSRWEFEIFFGSKSGLDGAAPAGTYTFTLDTAAQGIVTLTRPLGADAYPSSAPRIVNYTNLQGADPTLPITLQWQAFAGGTVDDFIQLRIEDANGDVFATGDPGTFGALNGTATSATVPIGFLSPNTAYEAYLVFAKVTSIDATTPGTTGMSAFFKETELAFTTGAPSTPPPAAGRFVFSSSAYQVAEGAGVATITLLRVGGAAAPAGITVTTKAGTAVPGVDYFESTNTYVLDLGVDALNIPVAILNDSSLDGSKTVQLSLSDATGGADIGSLSNAVLTITDDEQSSRGVIQFAPSQVTVDEGAGQVLLTLSRTGGSQGEVSVKYETDDVTAEDPEDFADSEGVIVFPSGVTSRTLVIPIVSDAKDEQDETFIVKLSDPTGGAALGTASVATVTIRDNDTSGVISFSAAAYPALESDAHVLLTVRRARGAAADVSVDFATEDLTAFSPDDYVGTNYTIVLASNELARTISIPIQQDSLPEGSESFRVTLRNASPGALLGPITNAVVTILDDEVTLQFLATAVTNRESSSSVVLSVERTGPVDVPASVSVGTLPGGTATPGLDFVPTNFTVRFPAGSRKQTATLRLINDQLAEGSETFLVGLSNPGSNGLLGSRSQATVTITDDDAGGKIQFALPALKVPEARTSALLIVTRTAGLASNVTCQLATRGLTATDGLDFVGTNTVLEWRANETRKLIRLPLLPDALVEGNEQFEVTLSDPTGGAVLDARTTLTATIADDDKGGGIGFARPEFVVSENATNAVIPINRTGGSAGGVTVRFLALEGTASSPADFTEQNVVVEFAPGQASRTVLVPIHNDLNAEGPETILLVLQEVTGGGVLSAATNATLRINDDESSVAFSSAAASGTEGASVTLTVLRAGALATAVSVDYTTVDGTATAGADYTAASGTLSFAANQASRTITIPLAADPNTEAPETFTVLLRNPQGGVQLGTQSSVTVTINDQPDPNAIPAAGNSYLSFKIQGIDGNSYSDSFAAGDTAAAPVSGAYIQGLLGGSFQPITANRTSLSGTTVTSRTFQFPLLRAAAPGIVQLTADAANGSAIYSKSVTSGGTPGAIVSYVSNQPGASGTVTIDVLDPAGDGATGPIALIAVESNGSGKKARVTGSFRLKGDQLSVN